MILIGLWPDHLDPTEGLHFNGGLFAFRLPAMSSWSKLLLR